MKKYSLKKVLLEALPNYDELTSTDRGEPNKMDPMASSIPISGMDAAGESTAPPSDPSRGYIWEETVMDCIEQARVALFDKLDSGSMGALVPDTNKYDISLEAGMPGNTAFSLGQNRVAKVELKLMPARFGSLRKQNLDELHFDGNTFDWTWETPDQIAIQVGDKVLNEMSADTATKNWLKKTVDDMTAALNVSIANGDFESDGIAKTKTVDLYKGKGVSLRSNLAKQAWKSVGGASEKTPREFREVARNAIRSNKQNDSNSFKIAGNDWIQGMGRKADLLLLGPVAENAHLECKGKVFSLNDKFSRFFPIIDISDVSISLRLDTRDVPGALSLRMEATPGTINNESNGVQFNSGSDLYNVLMRTIPGFERDFDALDDAVSSAGQDRTVTSALDDISDSFLAANPGEHVDTPDADMGQAQLRYSRRSPLNPDNRKASQYRGIKRDKDGNLTDELDLAHRKRKYSITSRLLGKK